jgi:hypothetical protein
MLCRRLSVGSSDASDLRQIIQTDSVILNMTSFFYKSRDRAIRWLSKYAVMLEIRQTQPTPITFGPCPKCQTPIHLAMVEPDKPGYEKRTFRCDSCGYSETKTVKYR